MADVNERIRIQLISDLHIEIAGIHSAPNAAELDAGADIVILAGDIASAHDSVHAARLLCSAPHIILVGGNHEHYRTGENIDVGIAHMKAEAVRLSEPGSQIHVLEDDECVVDVCGQPVRILGATLWTDFRLFGIPAQSSAVVAAGLNDFKLIRGSGEAHRFTARECMSRHRDSRRFLQAALAEEFDGPTIVLSHHLPSARCVSAHYADDPLSPGFASHCDDLVGMGAALWCYGHTHDSGKFRDAGGTLVVGNPAGYPRRQATGWSRENPQFDLRCVFTIEHVDGGWRAERKRGF